MSGADQRRGLKPGMIRGSWFGSVSAEASAEGCGSSGDAWVVCAAGYCRAGSSPGSRELISVLAFSVVAALLGGCITELRMLRAGAVFCSASAVAC